MTSAVGTLAAGSPSEFRAPDHKRFVEETTLLEILQETGDGLVDLPAIPGVICSQVAVSIPGSRPATAVINLHKPHAAFDQSSRGQAEPAKRLCRSAGCPVKLVRCRCLARRVHHIRHRCLHSKRQLVRLDASSQCRIVRELVRRQSIEPAEQSLRFETLGRAGACRRNRKGQRVLRVDRQSNSVVLRAKIVCSFGRLATAAVSNLVPHDDELRQAVVQ